MNKKLLFIPLAMLSMGMAKAQNSIDLAGLWQVSLDSLQNFQPISLPGNLDLAGLGTPNLLKPALTKPQLLHLTRKHRFVGAAFYRRTIDISKDMEGKPLTLTLERIIWQSQVWVDGKKLHGEMESLTTPHQYTLPGGLKAGKHELLIRIDNRKRYDMSTGEMAHAYTDETQVKWNGILGKMTLKAENPVKVLSIQTFPNVSDKSVKVVTRLARTLAKGKKYQGILALDVAGVASASFPVTVDQDTITVEKTLPLGDKVKLWDEFSPYIYGLKASFLKGKVSKNKRLNSNDLTKCDVLDADSTTFGMREISVKDGHFAVNGNRIFLRGTLECCIFPLTGCPPTDEAGWQKVFQAAKSWGLNHLRFHSYCPPEAAFRVADRMGFYLQIELPVWSLTIGKDPAMNRFLYDEYNRIIANYGNHPSFCLLSAGNELQPDFKFLNDFVGYMKLHDPRHLYTTTSFTFEKGHGSKPEPEDQYFVTQWTDKGWVRGQGVFDAEQPNFNKDYRQSTEGIHTPLVSHEIGQYSVYPNLQEIKKYTGTLEPLNFKAIRNDLQAKGLVDKADDYLQASGKLAVQLYKEEIERAMKTPKFDGFQLLGLQDFSGQGTALVGLVDAFWDNKGLTSERYFRQFNAPVTPLARFEKATWSSNEMFKADVEIANYGKSDITGKPVDWMLKDAQGKTLAQGTTQKLDKIFAQGELAARSISKGDVTHVGTIETSLAGIKEATQLTLQVSIQGTEWLNTWNIWVYPSNLQMPKTDVVMTQDIDAALKALKKGKKVLFSPKKENVTGLEGKFLPVFWSPVHFPKQAGTMGLLVNPKHPALSHFPTEMHSNWQWWNLVKRSRVMNIDSIKGASPIVEDVDNFTNNRRLCSVFEAKCGKGKLIVSSMDVLSNSEGKPEVKQMLYSLISYMNSSNFNPSGVIAMDELNSLWNGKRDGKSTSNAISLAGKWQFAQGDVPTYSDEVTLPGSMLTNGKGDDVCTHTQWTGSLYDSSFYFNPYMQKYRMEETLANGKHKPLATMKFPFFLTPEKHYVGNAWYRKSVFVPKEWKKQRVVLFLERPHIETSVYVNGKLAGRDSSLSVAHEFDVTPYIIYGKDNEIAIKIYNGVENVCVGQDSHSVTDQTQGNWNGIVGKMELQARQQQYIKNLQVYPDIQNKQVKVVMDVVGDAAKADFSFDVADKHYDFKKLQRNADGKFSVILPMGEDVKLWDEFNPNLYTLVAKMGKDEVSTTFGMSQIGIDGRQFLMNGKKIWMRGTVGNCCFPETGYPPTDEVFWIRIFKKCKEYGLNMMRFHTYCPPEAAFAAADKVGFYLQPEGPSWPNHGVKLGNGMTIDHYLMQETQRMVEKYGNHPSFCMLAAGNEPAGNWVKWVGDFVDAWKATGDKRRVYCGASVGGGWAWDPKSEYHVKGGARGLDWEKRAPQSQDNFNENMKKILQKGRTPITFENHEPFLTHEMGQWCAFPDLKETSQYTGAYKARNFEIFADLLRDNGMASQAEKFLHASGKLQTLAYKYDIERNLRTQDYAGFQMLSLNDYSGQGTALVGVLNVHWNEKGYCSANDWREFCSPIVPLAKFPRFVFGSEERTSIPVELYNAYKEPLRDAKISYRIEDENHQVYASGNLYASDDAFDVQKDTAHKNEIPVGKNINLGEVELPLIAASVSSSDKTLVNLSNNEKLPVKLSLTVSIASSNAPLSQNHWEYWVYPQYQGMGQSQKMAQSQKMLKSKDIYIADSLDAKAQKILSKGGKVLLLAAGKVKMGEDVKQTYLPVFWNTSWFKMRPPHTTGAYIDKQHPLFKNFPTDDWANLNWWELLNKAQVMNLRELPADYQPAIQPIDTWHVSRKLGMMIEARVGKGKLLMTTMDLSSDLQHRLVAAQMRKAILQYMSGADFQPSLTLDAAVITDFFTQQAPAVNMFTNDSPDELKPKLK